MCTFAEYGKWICVYSLITLNKKANIYQLHEIALNSNFLTNSKEKSTRLQGVNLEPRRVHLTKPVETHNSQASV
jgi:hypothetical protein